MLAAAERLFAERGFDGVSVRDLAAEADVNVAAVNYHFQGKENLYREVLLRRLHFKRDASIAALMSAERDARGRPDLDSLVGDFVRQYLEETLASAHGANFMRLIAWEMHDPRRGGTTFLRELVLPVHETFTGLLQAAAPGLGAKSASWAVMSLVGQIVHVIMRWYKCNEAQPGTPASELLAQTLPALHGPRDEYIQAAMEHLTRFSAGGVRALAASDRAAQEGASA
ncbi:MAG: TetR family transcriptional regulator [Candidatus Krumholzibacteriia bacterium]